MSKKYENMSEEEIEKEEKREARHQRRIRNQVLAWLVLLIILAGLGYGGYIGSGYLFNYLDEKQKQEALAQAEQEAETGAEEEDAFGIIATPEMEEDFIESLVEETEEVEEVQDEDAELKERIASMSVEQKAANLFIVTPESITGVNKATKAGEGTKTALQQYAVGGIVYRNQNISGADQFNEMIKTTKDMYKSLYNTKLWAFVEEDGVDPVVACSLTGVQKPESAKALGESGDSGNAYTTYINIATSLKNYRIDVNLGPVCDVNIEGNSFLGDSSFSNDADIVTSMVRQAVDAEIETGIMAGLQTFPGIGSADKDPAKGESKTQRTLDEMRESEFLPFQAGIEKGAQFIVVSNVLAENATGEAVPCSMSSTLINDVLRGELGFEGVVVTDHMNQSAITSKYGSGEAAVKAIQAGADMVLEPADFAESYQAVVNAINDGTISEERLNDALLHIYKLKEAE